MAYKEICRMVGEDDFLVNSNISNNKWFFDQLKSFLCTEYYENFVDKNITLEDLNKDTLFIMKYMVLNSSVSKICSQIVYFTSVIHVIIGLYNKFGKLLYD